MAYFSERIGLVTLTTTTDAEGYEIEGKEITKYVYGNRQSVTQAEFFSAGQQGIDAKYRFTIYASEYGGQALIKYGGTRYNVYRTYQTKEDLIELYVSEAKTEAVPEVSA